MSLFRTLVNPVTSRLRICSSPAGRLYFSTTTTTTTAASRTSTSLPPAAAAAPAPAMKSEDPDLKHFLAIPWAAAHINAPDTVPETAWSRFPKQDTEDELFSTTLHTGKTIAAFLTLYKRPPPSSSSTGDGTAVADADNDNNNYNNDIIIIIREVKALLTLRHGVNGYPGVSHGGVVATILDETIGLVLHVNKVNGLLPDGAYMTAYLNTQYVRPVRTPQTILVVATVKRVEGRRKFWIEGVVEDEHGEVLARADSLYVRVREKI